MLIAPWCSEVILVSLLYKPSILGFGPKDGGSNPPGAISIIKIFIY